MKAANQQLEGLWRPDMESKIWLMYVFGAFVALLFTFIFVKGREGKGLAEGVRYGLIMWMFVTVPMNVAWWVMLPIRIPSWSAGRCSACWRWLSRASWSRSFTGPRRRPNPGPRPPAGPADGSDAPPARVRQPAG